MAMDAAGNTATQQVAIVADRTAPVLQVSQPAAGALLGIGTPSIQVTYQDR